MKTDTIFYQLFQSFPSIFFELIQLPISEANNYRFDSVEVKQLSFRLDGVFLPQNNHPQTPIYFCEVQFQEDEAFYQRFFTEIFLYLSKTGSSRLCVIIFAYGIVKCLSGNTFRTILSKKLSV
ncbi:hypothetical protein myaer102_11350 [Microcystis viridis NIES-102]|uniref:YhcG PDDEXK nuclease domain-containing protein n=1 Tax=Microcystis viridis NIES-102 TaxID=213615 RepID=A0A3G9JL75_MICVR|nr:hypothetical protein myaer102_11350 [Microcystis viridis NIES-102]